MANPYPIEITDESGIERLAGTATFTDPGNQPGGGLPPQWTADDVTGAVTGATDGTDPVLTLTPGVINGDHQTLEARYSSGDDGLSVGDDSSISIRGRPGGVTSSAAGGVSITGGDATAAAAGGTVAISAGAGGPTAGADGGQLQLRAGDGEPTAGLGGDVTIAPGAGDTNGSLELLSGAGEALAVIIDGRINLANGADLAVSMGDNLGKVGFYNRTPIVQQTGVAVTAAAIHAALVNLGLITA